MREIILAHKVADSLLESKVSTLIKKYANIQSSFHLVKLKTVSFILFSVLANLSYWPANSSRMSKQLKAYLGLSTNTKEELNNCSKKKPN